MYQSSSPVPTPCMPTQRDLERMDASSDLDGIVAAVRVFSGVSPVKERVDSLEGRLDKITQQLAELHVIQAAHRDLDAEWAAHHDEIFDTKSDRRQGSIERHLKFLGRMASPKRQRAKVKTDGIGLNYHDEIIRFAQSQPGWVRSHDSIFVSML